MFEFANSRAALTPSNTHWVLRGAAVSLHLSPPYQVSIGVAGELGGKVFRSYQTL